MSQPQDPDLPRTPRRKFLIGTGVALTSGLAFKAIYDRNEAFLTSDVFVAKAASYDVDLEEILERGLAELGIDRAWVRGKTFLLKPNLVEPSRTAPHINTHPAVVRAAAEVLRRLDARSVFVGEGQGHVRDSYLVLEQSGLGQMLDEAKLEFVDLNHDDTFTAVNPYNTTGLGSLQLPRTLKRADVVVSMPKLKTHHWAGVTLSMKNLFGVLPGVHYGWPKNVLHRAGIDRSIIDLTASVRPGLCIVDGIVGMEGDGPIMGTPKAAGLVILGTNPTAVDATGCRLMGIEPLRLSYLRYASGRLGPVGESRITQRGESIASMAQTFHLLDHPAFDQFRGSTG